MDDMEGSQQESFKDATITDLIQHSATVLENECSSLEKEIEEKLQYLNQLKDTCKKQAENNEKQSIELERLKMMTQFEAMNRETCIVMNSKQRAKCQTMEKYFNDLCGLVNMGITTRDELTLFHENLSAINVSEEASLSKLRQECSTILSLSDKTLTDMKDLKEKEEKEFDEVKANLETVLGQQQQQIDELKEQNRVLESDCKELTIMIKMITPQNEELKQEYTNLENEVYMGRKSVNSVNEHLQSSLQEELKKKENLTEELKLKEKEIHDLNNNIRTKETEIETLHGTLKGLISEEEELNKANDFELEELNKLQSNAESLKEKFNHLIELNEENNTLKQKLEKLEELAQYYDQSFNDIEPIEKTHQEEIVQLRKGIEEVKIEIINTEKENNQTENKNKDILKEIEDETNDHKLLSNEIENQHQQLIQEQDSLTSQMEALSLQIVEINVETKLCQESYDKLRNQLNSVQTEFEETDSELSNFIETCNLTNKSMIEQGSILDEDIIMAEIDLKKAQSDIKTVEVYKNEINKMEKDFEEQHQNYEKEIKMFEETQNKKIEEKVQSYEELRIKYENEFKKKEQLKTDAMMEVKENNMKINEIQEQKILAEKDVNKLSKSLVRYGNLIKTMTDKLRTVAHVAIAPSQSTSCSQTTNGPAVSQASRKTNNTYHHHTGTPSSGETYVASKDPHKNVKNTLPSAAQDLMKKPKAQARPSNTQKENVKKIYPSAAHDFVKKPTMAHPSAAHDFVKKPTMAQPSNIQKLDVKKTYPSSAYGFVKKPTMAQNKAPQSKQSGSDSEGWGF